MQRGALSLGLVCVVGLFGAWSCTRAPSGDETKIEEAKPAARVSDEGVEPADPSCRDWSKDDASDLPPLPEGPHVATLDEVWRTVVEKHYDPTLGCVDWARMREVYAEKVAAAANRQQAFAAINEMLDQLEQSHFRLFEDGGGDDAMLPASPSMEVRWIEEQLVVVSSDLGSVPTGSVLSAIEGRTADALIDKARARTRGQSESAFAFAVARAATAALSCARAGIERSLELVPPGADAPVKRVVRCEAPRGELVSLGNLTNVPTHVEHRMLDGAPDGTKVGYLAFNVWMLPMVERVRAALVDLRARGMQALVLDLRGNPGGVGPMSVPVARMLLDRSANLGTLQFRDFAQTFVVEPDADPFTGPIALLVDEGTASTSEIFAAGMRDLGRITIFGGRATAGAALPSVIEELPSGAVLQYVVGDYHSPKGTAVEGKGIAPDVRVDETRADFVAGRDPVLEAAAGHLIAAIQN